MITPAELARRLADDVESVVKHLTPNAVVDGKELRLGSPNGESGKSCGVQLRGTNAGKFYDFATSEGGDLLDLWQRIRCCDLATAMTEAKRYLGIRDDEAERVLTEPRKSFRLPVKPASTSGLNELSDVMNYLTGERKLSESTLKAFKVGEADGHLMLFPYFRDGKARMIKQCTIKRTPEGKRAEPPRPTSKDQEPMLFGWQALDSTVRYVIICEGEIDAMSWHEVGQPALSVPFGGGAGAKQTGWIENEFKALERFDEILLSMDSDEVGLAATQELVNRLGAHRCRIIEKLPAGAKDANAALQSGKLTEELAAQLVKSAKSQDPTELKSVSTFTEALLERINPNRPVEGFVSPFNNWDSKIRFRPAELIIVNGINGHGKSIFLSQVALAAIDQNVKTCIASMEMPVDRLLERQLKQFAGEKGISKSEVTRMMKFADGRQWIFDLLGRAKFDRMLEVFRYAFQRYGVTCFIVDSLMMLGVGAEDYSGQKLLVEKLVEFKNELKITLFLVTHAKKQVDENQMTGKFDVAGAGAITDMADQVVTIWRNKPKEAKPEENHDKPDAFYLQSKNRNGDFEGMLPLWFDKRSQQYLQTNRSRALPYPRTEQEVEQ